MGIPAKKLRPSGINQRIDFIDWSSQSVIVQAETRIA
jgi:hypothetical protein